MKVKSLIVSLVLIVCFAGIGIGLYCAWPAITGTITDSKYYTSEDLQDAYDKGFDDAFKNKDELTQQVDYYKELTDTYYISILDYQAQIKDYETLTENNQNTISTLEQNKIELQSQVDNLTTIKNSNEETISDLQVEVDNLENQVKILTNSDSGKAEEIAELNKQITSLNNFISQLQNTNTLNVNTIASLNSQIESLNSQISNMTLQNQNASGQISALNNKIAELQESINYYEQYIASLENGEQVVATFEFDGSVYNIQIVNKNSIVTVTTPTSTDYVIFNYWTVNGEQVDLSTYQITTNTKFVANVTHKYDVKFKVDNTDYDSQIVVKNGYATLPEEPIKAGYEFDGWSLNGVDVVENISFTAVTQNVTYQAVFTKLHTVTFTYEEELKSTQQVRNGEYATDIEVENTNYKVFNGWKVNGSFVDIESYKINADTVFVADLTYKYDVKFMVDNEEYDHQIIIENGFVNLPEIPVKDGYVFDGWSLNGVDIIKNIDTVTVNENIIYKAVFTKFYKVTFMVDNEEYVLQSVKGNNAPSIPEAPSKSGYSFEGWSIDKQNIIDVTEVLITQNTTFYAMFSYYDFVAISWNGLTSFDGSHIWTDGENTYYSNFDEQYKLNKETLTWEPFLWNGLASFGSAVFTIDKDIYLYQKNNCYKLNKETSTWEPFQSLYLDIPTFSVSNIWTDGENTYYSDFDDQYKLNKETLTWEPFSWNGLTIIDGLNIWTDGNDIYYSFLSTYKLNKETLTWEIFIYDSNFSIGGVNIWTDGKNIYHSLWENHCKLNKETLSWETITWNGLTSFEGSKIWTDGNDIYYSSGSAQYSYTKILVCF